MREKTKSYKKKQKVFKEKNNLTIKFLYVISKSLCFILEICVRIDIEKLTD